MLNKYSFVLDSNKCQTLYNGICKVEKRSEKDFNNKKEFEMSNKNSLERHIEARRKKMIVDRILNKKSKVEKLRSVRRAVSYFSNISVHYV